MHRDTPELYFIYVSCFSKIQIVFTLLVPAHPGSPAQNPEGHKTVVVTVVIVR